MPLNLRPIIDDIASQADDFLAGASDRRQGRAGIEEFITLEHPTLSPADRKTVVDSVMAILEEEDFFGGEFAGNAFDDDDSDSDE